MLPKLFESVLLGLAEVAIVNYLLLKVGNGAGYVDGSLVLLDYDSEVFLVLVLDDLLEVLEYRHIFVALDAALGFFLRHYANIKLLLAHRYDDLGKISEI